MKEINHIGSFTHNQNSQVEYSNSEIGTFSGGFNGNFSGTFTGSLKGTATGSFNGDFNGSSSGSFKGQASGTFTGSFNGNFSGSSTGSFKGNFSGTLTGSFLGNFTGSLSGTVANISGKNLIINGTMEIDQRKEGVSLSIGAELWTLDRWKTRRGGTGIFSAIRSTTVPARIP